MFGKLIGNLLAKKVGDQKKADPGRLAAAAAVWNSGDVRGARDAYQDYLKDFPYSVEALNNLGVCYVAMGDSSGAAPYFEQAYSLDDTYLPAIINHARVLIDRQTSKLGLPFLREGWCLNPDFSATYGVYASMSLKLGDAEKARYFQREGWMLEFDNLRFGNGLLFNSAYAEVDEMQLAAEHRFWSETCKPLGLADAAKVRYAAADPALDKGTRAGRRIRIGYWSPDCRNHSVRYFLRPLLENHDKHQFEVHVYHDERAADHQTDKIKEAAEHFHDVYDLTDVKLYELMVSHKLDILIELAGHTSANRLPMLKDRMATVQVTALGYPPTTGMSEVDAKVLDRFCATDDASCYYAEEPMVLPNSFWCFDPMEEVASPAEPPALKNGYITFGCVGNLAKITDRMLLSWRQILDRLPEARLLIRSVGFEDDSAFGYLETRLKGKAFPMERILMKKPEGAAAFFQSYAEIDVILDTYPFNGGTTSCFAAYMGVPFVSMYGKSLTSRMGLSILNNLGAPELAVPDEAAYVEKALFLAQDMAYLKTFRLQARERFKASSLGNGAQYTKEFEAGCLDLLDRKLSGTYSYQTKVPAIPVAEAVRRAYKTLRSGQVDAANRIYDYCLRHYPGHGLPRLFHADRVLADQGIEEAARYLSEAQSGFDRPERIAALIVLIRWGLTLGQKAEVYAWVDQLAGLEPDDPFDRLQLKLYRAAILPVAPNQDQPTIDAPRKALKVLIPCSSAERYAELESTLRTFFLPPSWRLDIKCLDPANRRDAYAHELAKGESDIVIILQRNIDFAGSDFLIKVAASLEHADVIGIMGAQRWCRIDWRADDFAQKAAGYMTVSRAGHELRILGAEQGELVSGMAVLDGSVLAVDARIVPKVEFDENLQEADWLMEEDWAHEAFKGGAKLAVHRNLGVMLRAQPDGELSDKAAGRMHLINKRGFDPFSIYCKDSMMATVPVKNPQEGSAVATCLFSQA